MSNIVVEPIFSKVYLHRINGEIVNSRFAFVQEDKDGNIIAYRELEPIIEVKYE